MFSSSHTANERQGTTLSTDVEVVCPFRCPLLPTGVVRLVGCSSGTDVSRTCFGGRHLGTVTEHAWATTGRAYSRPRFAAVRTMALTSTQEVAKVVRTPRLVHTTWLHVQDQLSVNPWIFLPLSRFRPSLHRSEDPASAVSRKTEIVIEGFPRSGNTFAVVAFRQAQGRQIEIAHHLHAAAQIKRAVKLKVPAVVLIREPSEAILSVVAKDQEVSAAWALRSYIRFYSAVLPCLDRAVVVPFSYVTSDVAGVIRQVNAHYGTTFSEFAPSEDKLQVVHQTVERLGYQDSVRTGRDYRLSVGLPTEERQQAKEGRRTEYLDERNKPLRIAAESIYERILQYSRF
jgi:hypothetical protein